MNISSSSSACLAGQGPDRSQDGWWTTYRFDWLRQVSRDKLPPLAMRVAFVLVEHLNSKSLDCWPSQDTIANLLGVTVRGVRQSIAALVERGHLAVTVRRGRAGANDYNSNIYRPTIKEPDPSVTENRNERSDLKPEQPCRYSGVNRNESASKPESNGRYTGTSVPPNRMKEPFEESYDGESRHLDLSDEDSGRRHQRSQSEIEAAFQEWYRQYPKHVARAAALKAYRVVIGKKLATPAELLTGAMRYAAERHGQDLRYTKHPATWLNGGCWADEPTAPPIAAPTIDQDGNLVQSAPPPPNHPLPTNPHAARAREYVARMTQQHGGKA